MSLVWPELAPLLVLAPLVACALWALDRARARRFARLVGPRGSALAPRRARGRWALFSAAFLLALVALLQPSWGESARPVEDRGVDIVVCLDVSRSMLACDVPPSRLERARQEIRDLAGRAAGDRLGLVVFAGEARLAVPLTRDLDSLTELAGRADALSVGKGGTDLGAALETALAALKDATGEHESILLLTDGEDHAGAGLRAAGRCRERNITVHCVGLGSARGAKIPVDGAFLRDRAGAEVVSALDPSTLRRIADATGGEFLDALDEPRALDTLYAERIGPMARKSFQARARRGRENRFQWPLLGALLFWILDLCWSERKRR